MKSTSKLLINTLRMRDKTPPHPSTRTIIAVALAFATLVALLAYSPKAHSEQAGFNTTVLNTLTDSDQFGGCMIKVNRVPDQLSCRQNTDGIAWLSSRCDTEQGRDSFKQAQLALLTTGKIAVWVDDTDTTEGFCNVYRTILSQ